MTVFDDLEAEEERLEGILADLDDDAWRAESGAPGWTVTDVVVHLAQSEEMVVGGTRAAADPAAAGGRCPDARRGHGRHGPSRPG